MKKDKKIALPKVPKQSKDLVAEKKEQLKKLFPEIFEEDKLSFEELKKTLGEAVASNGERFGLQWSGKAECYQTIQTRSSATLKPNLAKENSPKENEHNFYICLEKINLEWMEEILKKEPAKIILLDSGFGEDDELKINCFQKIKILEQQKGQSIILKTI